MFLSPDTDSPSTPTPGNLTPDVPTPPADLPAAAPTTLAPDVSTPADVINLPTAESAAPLPPATRPAEAAPTTSTPVYPRSPRKRLEQQAASAKRIRSQPLVPPPAPLPTLPQIDPVLPPPGPWRWKPLSIAAAGVAWLAAVLMLTTNLSGALAALGTPGQLVIASWLLAALLTFGPLQWRLGLAGLAWQGALGWTLLGYIAGFVPPPTGNLLDLPDLPVYLLLFLAIFYAAASLSFPLAFWAGQRLFQNRLQRLDVRRARRQGYEVGLFAVGLLVMAGLRVLYPHTAFLLLIVVLLLESLLLSQLRPEG